MFEYAAAVTLGVPGIRFVSVAVKVPSFGLIRKFCPVSLDDADAIGNRIEIESEIRSAQSERARGAGLSRRTGRYIDSIKTAAAA